MAKEYTFEMNGAHRVNVPQLDNAGKRRYAEACSALIFGKTIPSEYNELKDKVASYLREKAADAAHGDMRAASEINSVLTLVVEPALLEATSLYGMIGNYHELEYNQVPEVETWRLVGGDARIQAYNGDVGFGTWEYDKYAVGTTTISGGTEVDYREIELGNFDSKLPYAVQHVITDMNNKTMAYIMDTVFEALKNNTQHVKFYTEYTGDITQTAVDAMVAKLRPFGKVSILGDYSVLAAISGWVGYTTVGTDHLPFYTDAQVTAMHNDGIQPIYKGSNLIELPNPYNLTKPLADKSAFERYYSAKQTLLIPQGMDSPVNIFTRGGVTTMVGTDVKTGRIVTRYDQEFGADVVRGMEYKIGAMVKTD